MKKGTSLVLSLLAVFVFLAFVLIATLFFAPEGISVHPARTVPFEDARLDLNTASAEDLRSLSGVGEVLSEAIVTWRCENGPFREKEDLLLVPGIGEKTYDGLKDCVTVGGTDENTGRG